MINLYIVRHGETSWNKESICQGRSDLELNEKGINESKEVSLLLKENNYKFDIYVSSPLKRALKTAEIIKETLTFNKNDILLDDKFIERDFGYFEGKKNKLFTDAYKNNDLDKFYESGLEKEDALIKRVVDGLNELFIKYDNKDILLVSHSNIIRALLVYIDPNKYNFLTKIPNLSISFFKIIDKNKFELNKLYLFENNYEDKTIL